MIHPIAVADGVTEHEKSVKCGQHCTHAACSVHVGIFLAVTQGDVRGLRVSHCNRAGKTTAVTPNPPIAHARVHHEEVNVRLVNAINVAYWQQKELGKVFRQVAVACCHSPDHTQQGACNASGA